MTPDEYQIRAMETALYPEIPGVPVYTALGMMGEVGELAGKLILDDSAGALDELGDILWYIAAMSSELGISMSRFCGQEWADAGAPGGRMSHLARLMAAAGALSERTAKKPWRDHRTVDRVQTTELLASVYSSMVAMADAVGFSLGTVASRNIAKLASRKERGQLGGNGDTR